MKYRCKNCGQTFPSRPNFRWHWNKIGKHAGKPQHELVAS